MKTDISTKFIFVTGGVVSGIGKGVVAAGLGRLLKQRGLSVSAQKLDPYMNVDPGMMSPFQHGEVFVTDDGAETDLDIGHYERFIDENLARHSSLSAGKIYWRVLERERAGGYLGGTVQVIPHITHEIKEYIYNAAAKTDVLITEIGGTTGDIEGQPFLEAIRQVSLEMGERNCLFIHVTLVPYLKCSGEHKSKPTQHSVRGLHSMGITPKIIVTRADEPIDTELKDKIALFCNVKPDCVIENLTLDSLYDAPLALHQNRLDSVVCRELSIEAPDPDLTEWRALTQKIASRGRQATIAIVGKYVRLRDAYLSIIESLHHAGFESGAHIDIRWVDSESVTSTSAPDRLGGVDGIIIPGGFGDRGIAGKIAAARYARERDIPCLGIGLGMQVAIIEFARNVCGLADADSGEFNEQSSHKVIDIMPDQIGRVGSGGTMRLGAYPCVISPGTWLARLYNEQEISERHRHRFELNNDYRDILAKAGLVISGLSPDNSLVEAIELPQNKFFVGVQFHPEFKSRPNRPHPIFLGLVQAALGKGN